MIKIYVGKSASGKDFFLNKAVKDGFKRVVSYTTRPIRPNEVNGRDYDFVTADEFKKLNLMESRKYETNVAGKKEVWYYGTPILQDYKTTNYVVVVDINGAMNYLRFYGSKYCDIVYVNCLEELREQRAVKRGGFDKTEWDRRAADDKIKFSENKINLLSYFAGGIYVIINNFELNDIDAFELKVDSEMVGNIIRHDFKSAFDMVTTGDELSDVLNYRFNDDDIINLSIIHEQDNENIYRTKIEDLLTDCYFYIECEYLIDGDYDAIKIMYQSISKTLKKLV